MLLPSRVVPATMVFEHDFAVDDEIRYIILCWISDCVFEITRHSLVEFCTMEITTDADIEDFRRRSVGLRKVPSSYYD